MSAIVRSKGVMPSLQCERSAILLCGLGLALATAVCAQGVGRDGEEFDLSGPRGGDQSVPQIALGPTVGYVVWQDNGIDGPNNSFGIAARRFNPETGVWAPVFRANQTLAGPQENPQVALLRSGGAAFVWQGGRLGSQDIYFRTHVPGKGFVPKTDLRVNTFTRGQQGTPVIACLTNGNLAVAWSSLHQDGHLQGVYGRVLTPGGKFLSAAFRVNQFTGNNQRDPAITTLSNGNFVVVWISENQGVSTLETIRNTNRVHVYGRLFTKAGAALGTEFRINTRSNLCAKPSVAPCGTQGFTVAWAEKSDNREDNWDIYARSFSAPGATPSTDALLVNSITYGDQLAPKIAQGGEHQLVVWSSLGHDGSREGVFGRALKAGQIDGNEFRANTHTNSSQIHPCVVGNGRDRLWVGWSSFMGNSSFDVRGQRYDGAVASSEEPAIGFQAPSVAMEASRLGGGGPPLPPTPLTPVIAPESNTTALRVSLANTSKGKRLSWNTEPGRTYQVQYSTNFTRWENLGEARPATASSDSTLVGNGENAAVYRVVRLQ